MPHNAYARGPGVSLVRVGLFAVLVSILFAGCTSVGPAEPVSDAAEVQQRIGAWNTAAKGCQTTSVFFLVDEWRVHEFLPLGFAPQDLSQFYYNTPVTSSKIPVFVAISQCDELTMDASASGGPVHEGSLDLGYIGIYVQPPAVAGRFAEAPADHNFYALTFLAPGPEAANESSYMPVDATQPYGWSWSPAELELHLNQVVDRTTIIGDENLTRGLAVPDAVEVVGSSISVRMDGEDVYAFRAGAFFPHPFREAPSLRFWHVGPHGTGFMEFDVPFKTVAAGPLERCTMASGSTLAHVLYDDGEVDGRPCALIDSFALVFSEHQLEGRFRHLEGAGPA